MTAAVTQPDASQKQAIGAPIGNRNACRSGMHGSGLPKGCEYIQRSCNEFRRALERAVEDARGQVLLLDAANISTAFRHERHCQLAQRWLRIEGDKMSHSDRLAHSREVARASSERDRSIAALKLPAVADANPWDIVDQPPEKPQEAATEPATSDTMQTSTYGQTSTASPTEPLEAQ